MGQAPLFTIPAPTPANSRGPAWPLWAVYAVGVVGGAVILAAAIGASAAQVPAVAAVSALAFMAFAAACVWLLSRIPYFDPVRRETVVLAVLWGGVAAAGWALLGNVTVRDYTAANGDTSSWSLVAPFIEEPLKDLGVLLVLVLVTRQPRTALDGLVAGSFVGLGFETTENIVNSLTYALTSDDRWASLTSDVVHEVLRRSWTGHIVITGVAGFGIAYAMTQRQVRWRWGVGAGLVVLALAGHLLWNSHRFGIFYVLGQFGMLGLYLWLIRVGRAQESRLYVPYLAHAPALVDPALADSMHTAAARKAYRRAHAGTCSRRDQRAVARLAAAIGNGDAGAAHAAARQLPAAESTGIRPG